MTGNLPYDQPTLVFLEMAQDLGRDLGRDLSRDLSRDLGRDLGRELGREGAQLFSQILSNAVKASKFRVCTGYRDGSKVALS